MRRRMKGATGTAGDTGDSPVAVNVRVRVYPGTDGEVGGTVVEDFGDLAGQAVNIGDTYSWPGAEMGGHARCGWSGFRRQRPVGRRIVLAVAVYLPSGDHLSQLRRYRTIGVPASVQNPRSHSSQRSDCSISSSCLSRSVNSIARRRNWRATAARRCSSSARRSSRPILCASVCMVVAPRGLAVKCRHPAVCGWCADLASPRRD